MDAVLWIVLIGWFLFGNDFWLWPIRLPAYLHARKEYPIHEYRSRIRRDIGVIINSCDTCFHRENNWIHRDAEEVELVVTKPVNKIQELERANIKLRFETDPDWVKVFGDDYDPVTFEPVPLLHNGECGGPNDSCPRCIWEYNQKQKDNPWY